MRKHYLLLSLLVMFFAVFTTACGNTSLQDANISAPDKVEVVKPIFKIQYNYINSYTVEFNGEVIGGDENNYNFTWNFGDGETSKEGLKRIIHKYNNNGEIFVTLSAELKNPDIIVPIPDPNSVRIKISDSGIIPGRINYKNVSSSLDFTFDVSAVTTDNSPLTYTWDFGDGTVEETDQSAINHVYKKYNKTYQVRVTISNGSKSVEAEPVFIGTPDLKAVVNVVNDSANSQTKTFSVDIYDENDNLIHGSSANGEVNGLNNVLYSWDFGDGQFDNDTTKRVIEHTYVNPQFLKYKVVSKVTSDNYDGEISSSVDADIELSYSLTTLNAVLVGDYGIDIEVSAKGNGGMLYAGKKVIYKFSFPDGTYKEQEATHDAQGNMTDVVKVSKELLAYCSTCKVKVEVIDNGKIVASGTITAPKPSFEYELNITSGSSYFSKTFTVTPKAGSFILKDATFSWNFGEGQPQTNKEASVSHTYTSPGLYTVTVDITSPLLEGSGITVKQVSKQVPLEANFTIDSYNCVNNGAEFDFLQYTCTVNAVTAGGTLTYKWYIDGAVQANQTGKSFTYKYSKYNQIYNVKVDVGVQGSDAVKSDTLALLTPNVKATVSGPDNLQHGQTGTYVATTTVTHNGASKAVSLQGVNYTFKIAENNTTVDNGNSNTWNRSYAPNDNEYNGNSVNRTVRAEITATNLNGTVTSSTITTAVNKVNASLSNFQSAVVSCSPENGVNLVRQHCKVTLTVKNNAQGITGNFKNYRARITSQGVTKLLFFGDKAITAGASQVSDSAVFEYSWPNNGEINTGQSKTSNYTVSAYVFEWTSENNRINATSANVNINLNMDYVLFPKTVGYEGKFGGSGYTFGTWSCGYNEKYEQGTLVNSKCASNQSMSGQTLKLGSLVDSNGNLKGKTKFEWYMRINKEDGHTIPDTRLKEFTVNAGSKPSDEDLKFNVASAIGYRQYIGSAYNSTNRVFYLKISVADENQYPLIKPIKVWYDGTNKTSYGNRLQRITPIARNEHKCEVMFEYVHFFNKIYYLKVHLTQLEYNFDGSSSFNSNDSIIPTGGYKPIVRVFSNPAGSNWSRSYVDDYTNYGIKASDHYNLGWHMYNGSSEELRLDERGRGNSNVDLNKSSASIQLVFKDMLKGSGSQLITDYYKPINCTVTQKMHY